MITFLIPVIKISACFTTLFLLYWFFLRKETWFRFNRFYLLAIITGSLITPWVHLTWLPSPASQSISMFLAPVNITSGALNHPSAGSDAFLSIIVMIYFTGIGFLCFRFIRQCFRLVYFVLRNGKFRIEGADLVQIRPDQTPFSFFRLVFVPTGLSPEKRNAIISHEKTHVYQWHSLDILIVEMFLMMQWFNPFAWLLAAEIRNLHEYLADESTLKSGIQKAFYQQLILETAFNGKINYIANYFNVSQIKNRIIMMSGLKSGNRAKLKMILVVPVAFSMFILFSTSVFSAYPEPQDAGKEKAKTDQQKEVMKAVEVMPSFPGGDEARMKFMMENLKYPEEAIKKNITGKVFVNFIVKTDGSIDQVKLLKGIGAGCDEEAMRVIKMMPKWKPGMNKGKPVEVQFTMPVYFTLDSNKDAKKDAKKENKASKPEGVKK